MTLAATSRAPLRALAPSSRPARSPLTLRSSPLLRAARALAAGAAALAFAGAAFAQNAAVKIVAAENFYGDVAKQIGGAHVAVSSVLSNPDQDPHLFEASPKVARELQRADLVIYNGADYDPWMAKLLAASKNAKRTIVVVAELVGRKAGDNPHLWYDPATMPAAARALAAALGSADPAHKAEYDANLARFVASMKPVDAKVAELRARYKGAPVTATEPVFGYMADAIGLDMRNQRFQLATMNNTEASPADVAAFENDLKKRQVRVLIYNSQAVEPMTKRMLKLAQDARVPSVSVTETQPAGKTFQQWMLAQLDALAAALGQRP
ncbi:MULTISPECIES: metal ABC transporter solute-binding protein, Zn/Mn family [Burkholderia]|uniref:Cation ABC transporter substrate-binding protein n=1 Tax=Burkholderia savannae TaxID=1637837 RepID=A0ABR5TG76_9BURK|nr:MULTISPECIES: zinc ABC transporter substrate-binding protein [Burkholderia]AOJ69800.1 cation ABC transporter substrate-binding protein [Burkholderia savannae]AOK47931.1 cation ABC transporter substrate-binding protein [Burkholderia sp. MSMB617WGS]KVG41693.1 cation ABC transporter substrate-binding protein [Burkholderia sp. MSMB0265]KVG88549.1 cation ABC transporter substrate-binding protein [Burkholderia sp. MSMB2040]KVG94764.1 cation ABC transporter substrate-binding protein [Burkholderia 